MPYQISLAQICKNGSARDIFLKKRVGIVENSSPVKSQAFRTFVISKKKKGIVDGRQCVHHVKNHQTTKTPKHTSSGANKRPLISHGFALSPTENIFALSIGSLSEKQRSKERNFGANFARHLYNFIYIIIPMNIAEKNIFIWTISSLFARRVIKNIIILRNK